MSEVDKSRMIGGAYSLEGGVNSGIVSSLLKPNQMAFMVNGTVRGGFAMPRPKYIQHVLNFADDAEVDAVFSDGETRFQHLSFYDGNGHASLIAAISGKIYRIELESGNFVVQDISPPGNANSSIPKIGWSLQAENYFIYQDNQSPAIIYNGAASRRSDTAHKEVPVGNVMAYGQGRITVALPDQVTFRIGDLIFSSSGTPVNGYKDAILKFTENDFLNEGGDLVARIFGAPSNSGPIMAIRNISQLDSSLGQGPQMVYTTNAVFSINAPFDRTTWKNLTSPIQTVAMIDYGATGQQSTIPINGDMFYRSPDGWRTLILARRQFGEWGNTPISTEMDRILPYDTDRLLQNGSGVLFDNRLLGTCSPVDSDNGVYHRALAVMDFHLISSLGMKLAPVWEGIWTGLRILAVVKGVVLGVERCFALCLGDDNGFQLWEITKVGRFDDDQSRIKWSIELPSNNFGNPDDFKRLAGGDCTIDKIAGQVNIAFNYRVDQELCWREWDSIDYCAKYQDCVELDVGCKAPSTYSEMVQEKRKLRTPPDVFDSNTDNKLTRVGAEFQPRLDITGYCRLKRFRMFAYPEQEFPYAERRANE